jgi:hypothetical protein
MGIILVEDKIISFQNKLFRDHIQQLKLQSFEELTKTKLFTDYNNHDKKFSIEDIVEIDKSCLEGRVFKFLEEGE